MLKFVWRSLVLLILLVAAGILGTRAYLARSLPLLDGTLTLRDGALQHPVDIYRDDYGIPHIYAQTDADMMFALGYVHAQDRLYQMDFQRRVASGQVAALWGANALGADRFTRTLGFHKLSQDLWDNPNVLSAQTRADLSAYAKGVNAFLAEGNALPPEFTLANLSTGAGDLLGPWTAADSLAWLKVMSLDLGGTNFRNELARLYLAQRMEEARIGEFFFNGLAPYPGTDPFVLPDLNVLYGLPAPDTLTAQSLQASQTLQSQGGGTLRAGNPHAGDLPQADLHERTLQSAEIPAHLHTLGSNNWVIDGHLMESGASVLANDPHLGLSIPGTWYFAHISSAESGTNAIGATFPGYPSIIIGRNDHLAWGFTNTGPDVQDLFVERISRQTGLYETPTGWEPLQSRTEEIAVAGQDTPEQLVIRSTRHGPLISDILDVPAVFPADQIHDYGFALQWTSILPTLADTTANAASAMLRARTYEAFVEGVQAYVAPQQNMVVLEVGGRIGWVAAGRVPIRKADNAIQGWAPSPGWDARYDWQGFIPFSELPQGVDPAAGHIITANSDITPPGYAHFITRDWALPLRHDRIHDLLITQLADQGKPLTLAHMEATILDNRINPAALALPAMLANLDLSVLSEEDQATAQELIARLEAWAAGDYSGNSDEVGPTLFFTWYRDFVFDAIADDVGLAMTAEVLAASQFSALRRFNPEFARDLADGTAQGWCEGADCGAHLAHSLLSAHGKLAAALGTSPDRWTWDRLHVARSEHPVLAKALPLPGRLLKLLTGLQTRIDRPHGGGPASVNASGFSMDETLDFNADGRVASLRLLVEAGRFEEARFVHAQGQSGLPQSPHFQDMADLWAAGDYAPMIMDRAKVEGKAKNHLRLEPPQE
jgi:penicillin amidase